MIKLFASICIDAPVQAVWDELARLENIQLWSEPVLHARCEGALSRGVGAERTCDLSGGITIRERWLAWNEGKSFTYEGFGIPMIKRATNRWSVHPEGEMTLLISEAELELKGGVLGRMLEPIMGNIMRRMGPNAFAGFKYLVENGQPYPGKHSELPRATPTC